MIPVDQVMPSTEVKREDFLEVSHHCSRLRLLLNDLRSTSTLCDINIKVNLNGSEKCFSAHKVVLAASSQYFRAMFCGGFREAHAEEITIRHIDPELFATILDYIYTLKMEINEKTVEKLMIAATIFQLNGAIKLCINFIKGSMNISNCIKLAALVWEYGCNEPSSKIDRFIEQHFMEIAQTEELKSQPQFVIFKILSLNDLHVVCESQVYDMLLNWVKFDLSSRKCYLNTLIHKVRCHLLKPKFLSSQLENCPIVQSTCYDFLKEVFDNIRSFNPESYKPRQLDIPQVMYAIANNWSNVDDYSLNSLSCYINNLTSYSMPTLTSENFKIPMISYANIDSAFIINGFIFVLTKNGEINRYNPVSNTMKKCKSLEKTGSCFGLGVLNNEIYVFRKSSGCGAEPKMMKYDPVSDEWENRGTLKTLRIRFGCVVVNQILYLVGGEIDRSAVSIVTTYDAYNNKWGSIKPMMTPRAGAGVVALGDYIYVIAGTNYSRNLESVERYNVYSGDWEEVASVQFPRQFFTTVIFHGKIYAFGGRSRYHDFEAIECYNEEKNEWKVVGITTALTNGNIKQVVVSYQPCVPDKCVNFPF